MKINTHLILYSLVAKRPTFRPHHFPILAADQFPPFVWDTHRPMKAMVCWLLNHHKHHMFFSNSSHNPPFSGFFPLIFGESALLTTFVRVKNVNDCPLYLLKLYRALNSVGFWHIFVVPPSQKHTHFHFALLPFVLPEFLITCFILYSLSLSLDPRKTIRSEFD